MSHLEQSEGRSVETILNSLQFILEKLNEHVLTDREQFEKAHTTNKETLELIRSVVKDQQVQVEDLGKRVTASEIRQSAFETNLSWLLKFFWLVVTPTIAVLVGAILYLVIKSR